MESFQMRKVVFSLKSEWLLNTHYLSSIDDKMMCDSTYSGTCHMVHSFPASLLSLNPPSVLRTPEDPLLLSMLLFDWNPSHGSQMWNPKRPGHIKIGHKLSQLHKISHIGLDTRKTLKLSITARAFIKFWVISSCSFHFMCPMTMILFLCIIIHIQPITWYASQTFFNLVKMSI